MIEGLPTVALAAIFAAAAAAIWIAGIRLAASVDVLSRRWGLGEALGGAILLAIVTNLPEIAITVSAAWAGNLDVAVGNILGGIAIQTVVLAGLDWSDRKAAPAPLAAKAASLTLVVEGLVVIAILLVTIMATQMRVDADTPLGLAPPVLIAGLWVIGVMLVGRANRGLPWRAADSAAVQTAPKGHAKGKRAAAPGRPILTFLACSVVTLVAGVLLERSGDGLAAAMGMSGLLFGATVLAAATALPELSTGIGSMRLKDYQLAISDIFGGNAFLPVLFLLAALVSGQAVLPRAQASDIYLAALGALLTSVYLCGLIFRPRRRMLGMGLDSLIVLILYAVGIAGLALVAASG